METQRLTLWCKVLGKFVEAEIATGRSGVPGGPGVPAGWSVRACVEKGTECFGTGCPLTTDEVETPFGEVGELPGGPPERVEPTAEASFEGEWD